MVDNQHAKIAGYRDLTEEEIQLMNSVKELGNHVGSLVDGMSRNPDFDQRWVAIAQTDLQKGFMALVRSIARPGGF